MQYPAIAISDYFPSEHDASDYLQFNKDDDLVVTTFYENGWCFGAKASEPQITGFIPINHIFVQIPEEDKEPEKKEEQPQLIQEPQKLSKKTISNQKKDKRWISYVNDLMNDNEYLKELLNPDEAAEKGKLYLPFTESAFGYENFIANKQVKIGKNTQVKKEPFQSRPDLSLFSLSYEQTIPKQFRQLNHYFDYDRWVEWVNETGIIPKGKPDPTKRKKNKQFHLKLREIKF